MATEEARKDGVQVQPQHGAQADAVANKRYIVIRNGRGIIADGNDMSELESAYAKAAQRASSGGRQDRLALGGHGFPAFGSLARCDHEGETGKVCIVDAEQSAHTVRSYYGVGFVS
jgi:hypothetical protein